MKFIISLCFYFPLITNLLNLQGFISMFGSETYAQIFAYTNMALLSMGIVFVFKRRQKFSPLVKMWVAFFILYYAIGILANIHLGTNPPILKTLVPVVYFAAFSFLLSNIDQLMPVSKILTISFFTSCVLLILFKFYNFSLDYEGIYEYQLERAGGVYGDANNASLAAILSFIFLRYIIKPRNKIEGILKIAAMAISVYAILITFSKTAFIVLLIVLCLVYHRLFSVKRILLTIIFLPITLFAVINWSRTTDVLSFSQRQRVESLVNLATFQSDKVEFSDRDVLFRNMLSFIGERPFLGNGIYFSTEIRGHNTIFGVWADAGIFIFSLFLIMLIYFFKKSFAADTNLKFFSLSILMTLTLFMLTLQTIINQGYLMVVFVLIGYLLYRPVPIFNSTYEETSKIT